VIADGRAWFAMRVAGSTLWMFYAPLVASLMQPPGGLHRSFLSFPN